MALAMAILKGHIPFYRELFALPGFLADPVLMLGLQAIEGDDLPEDFAYPDGKQLLQARGLSEVSTLDLFDDAADLRYDLNDPVPAAEHDRYRTVIDIGTIEHLFDARQCIENYITMVRPGGFLFVHTPVKGYAGHGFHTFSAEFLVEALRLNGFRLAYLRFSSDGGEPLEGPGEADDVLIWIAGRKRAQQERFQVPQQQHWRKAYS